MNHHCSPALDGRHLSQILLNLHASSQTLPMADFLPHALAELGRAVPFDSAWWAVTNHVDGRSDIHCSFVQGLPDDMADRWLSVQHDEVIGKAVRPRPGKTLHFTPAQVDGSEGSRWLARTTGFRHVLCTATPDTRIGQLSFLALSRHSDSWPFTVKERRFKELVMPHLAAALSANRLAHIRQVHEHGVDRRSSMGVVDKRGVMHTVEPGFVRLLQREWPQWTGPKVPPALLACLESGQQNRAGERVHCSVSWTGSLALVTLSPASKLDQLTARERGIALRFASGSSHKVVARDLDIAPTTVRHHLRAIYTKLGISDKGQIAQIVWQETEPQP